jgi:hypothetical protein
VNDNNKKLIKKAFSNPIYGYSVFAPFKQPAKNPVENKETENTHNPIYINCLSLRGQNYGMFDLKGVALNDSESADISILVDSGEP